MAGTMYPPESIYNLIPREEVTFEKPPRYMSKFREQVKLEKQANKASNKTMGPATVEVPLPEKYLLKRSKGAKSTEKKPVFDFVDEFKPRKPRVPPKSDKPLMGIHTRKDFVKTNAIENIMAVPKKPQPIYVDTKKGDKHPMENSGLVPKYLKKKDYGETPEYLTQRREEVKRAQEEYDNYVQECMKQGAMKQLSDDERKDILEGLKNNWDELHHQYQGLSVVTDTTPKKHRKERIELEMKQLERDIDLIERYKSIFISNN
ncbi:enkurin [Clupea harengus]|uniref:Enkurin n=1 Tax=Clupea harengus TaxID=7950 RepID=A0A6P3VFD3_CLUHA|nr:enkurin [Clupea harengus]